MILLLFLLLVRVLPMKNASVSIPGTLVNLPGLFILDG